MKKLLTISFWIISTIGILVLLSFVNSANQDLICQKMDIYIDESNQMYFLKQKDIEEILQRSGNAPFGKKLKNINVSEIEKILNAVPEVETANVFIEINGDVGIIIKQRTPIVRILNRTGPGFFMDDKGFQMPISKNFFPRVPVASGYINEPFYDVSVFELVKDSLKKSESIIDEIFAITSFIQKSTFWNAQIQEIYINKKKEIELIPMVGQHRIIFGDTSNLQGKFEKLYVFYERGIETGGWNKYDTINLKFKNQIVCTLK